MNATNELFDRYKAKLGVTADLGGAKALGIKAQTVSNWRNRGSQASPKLIEAMCKKTGEDTARWLLRVQTEQEPNPADGAVWKRVAKQLRVQLAVASFAIAALAQEVGSAVHSASQAAMSMATSALDVFNSSAPTLLNVLA